MNDEIKNSLRAVLSCVTKTLTKVIPKKQNRWIFGSWFGNSISDNSKALYNYVEKEHPEIEIIWFVNDPKLYPDMRCRVIKRNSLAGAWLAATAQVAAFNQGYQDFASVNLLGGCFTLQMWHGVAWKKIGHDAKKESKLVRTLYRYIENYSMYIAPSEEYGKKLQSGFFADKAKILYVGQPRNEVFFCKGSYSKDHEMISNMLGISNKKIIAYLPTFRDKRKKAFSFFQRDIIDRVTELGKEIGFVIIEKSHFVDQQRSLGIKRDSSIIYECPNIDAQVLMAGADMLITDYSSCYFDFVLTDRPIIHFIYDYDYYKDDDRGLYYSSEEATAGTAVKDYDQLLAAIRKNLDDPTIEVNKRRRIREVFVPFESADNSKIIVNEILKRTTIGGKNEKSGSNRRQ